MITFDRAFFTSDPVMGELHQFILKNHTVPQHTQRVLLENKHVKDFCEEARCFAVLPGKSPIYLHYDVSSWYKHANAAEIKIESIVFYDDFTEYTTARLQQLHSGQPADIPNIN